MILQALYEYYQRKASDPDSNIAPEGWEWKEIPYLIVIDNEGNFVSINDTREGEGKLKRAKKFLLPQSVKRTVKIKAYLLWDNIEYTLGANPRHRDDITKRHEAFKKRIRNELGSKEIPSIQALLKFLDNNPIEQIERANSASLWEQIQEENPFIAFKIDGELHSSICDDVGDAIVAEKAPDNSQGVCLITGEQGVEITRLHPDIKGVRGANTKGAALVSFNLSAYSSFNKSQNFNAPISKSATFAYTTALNLLLNKDSKNKVSAGDATIVFWAEKQIKSET